MTAFLIIGLVCLAIGAPILIVSVMSLKYHEGKPFQAKVLLSGDDAITVKYKIRGKAYIKDIPWKQPHPLASKPKSGQNVTVKGTPNNPTGMIWSKGGLESSFALKIVGVIIGGLFCAIGSLFLLFLLFSLIINLINKASQHS